MNSNQQKSGAMVILIGLFVSILLGVIGWVGIQASHVPTLEATFKTEIHYLNKNLETLTKTAQETNGALHSYTKYHAANLARITEAIVTQRIRLDDVDEHCRKTEVDLKKCKFDTDKRLDSLHIEVNKIKGQ